MTNLLKKNDQTGRSMVEMLGVLAIIGVLSVGGIAGYSKAMTKFKITKTFDQVSMTVANIRTLYSGQRSYSGLKTANAFNMGVVPAEMEGSSAGSLVNAFQGSVTIGTGAFNSNTAGAFYISYGGLGREACVSILTADWGSGSSSGFIGITVGSGTSGITTASVPTVSANSPIAGNAVYGNLNLPVSPSDAATSCNCTNEQCVITWYYL